MYRVCAWLKHKPLNTPVTFMPNNPYRLEERICIIFQNENSEGSTLMVAQLPGATDFLGGGTGKNLFEN